MPDNKKTFSIDGVVEDIISVFSFRGSSSTVFRIKSDPANVSDFVAGVSAVKYPGKDGWREAFVLSAQIGLSPHAADSVDLRYHGTIHSDCIGKPVSYQLTIDVGDEPNPSFVSGTLRLEVECSLSRKRIYEESCLFEAPRVPTDTTEDDDDWPRFGG